jgi:hypothetical protein
VQSLPREAEGEGSSGAGWWSWPSSLISTSDCFGPRADRIHPEWQHRDLGDKIFLHPALGMPVTYFAPQRGIELEGWGAFELEPAAGGRTRLIARNHATKGLAAILYAALLEIPHFLMERRMLLGIKARAEWR